MVRERERKSIRKKTRKMYSTSIYDKSIGK